VSVVGRHPLILSVAGGLLVAVGGATMRASAPSGVLLVVLGVSAIAARIFVAVRKGRARARVPGVVGPGVDVLWNMRWRLLASCTCVLFAIIVLIATQPTHWRWPLLVWGLLIGLAGTAAIEALFAYEYRHDRANTPVGSRWQRRRLILIFDVLWVFFGGIAGLVAAAFDLLWVDIGLTAYTVVSLGAGGLVMIRARRRTPV
jgi:hypothetical protein